MRKKAITPEQACGLLEVECVEFDKLIESINDQLSKSYREEGELLIFIDPKLQKVKEKI